MIDGLTRCIDEIITVANKAGLAGNYFDSESEDEKHVKKKPSEKAPAKKPAKDPAAKNLVLRRESN